MKIDLFPLYETLKDRTSTPQILRILSVNYEENVSDSKWVRRHKLEIKCLGRVLQFLGLAEPWKKSEIGWDPTPEFMSLLTTLPPPRNWSGPKRTEHDALIIDMLKGIVVETSIEWCGEQILEKDSYEWTNLAPAALGFTERILYHLNLTYEDKYGFAKPTPILKKLFALAIKKSHLHRHK